YFVLAQNDAAVPDAVRLKGTASTTRFGVRYSVGATDITASVTAGTYTTPTLAPGGTELVKVVVTVKNGAPPHTSLAATLVLKSDASPAIKDTVRFVTSRS